MYSRPSRTSLGVLVTLITVGAGESQSTMPGVAARNAEFAFNLYSRIASQVDGNMFMSPVSISTALAMTYAGIFTLKFIINHL